MEHVIRLRGTPDAWHKGLPLGNGEFGAMAWRNGHRLAFTLDRADLWDLRINTAFRDHARYTYATFRKLIAQKRFAKAKEIFEGRELRDNPVAPTKTSIGRVEIRAGADLPANAPPGHGFSLDLDDAVLRAHEFEAFLHKKRNVLCIRLTTRRRASITLRPVTELTAGFAGLAYPAPSRSSASGVTIVLQQIPGGPCWAVAWKQDGPCIFLAAETAPDASTARDRAARTVAAAAGAGYARLKQEHTAAWKDFWAESAVTLPEHDLEMLWYYGVYLLASSAKRGCPPPGLQGLWAMDGVMPPWRGDYHADMNVQETFWPAAATGHIDLLDTWCDLLRRELPLAREFTRRFFGTEGAFRLACTLPEYTSVWCWHTVQFAWSHTGWLAWLAWLRWRYSLDADWLRDTGYPIVAESFRFFRANLERGRDGRLHVPLSSSPEYGNDEPRAFARDPNVDLALIRKTCDWVVEMERALPGLPARHALTRSCRDIRKRLTPYALNKRGELQLWPAQHLDESHRHPSHLMAIHPAMDITVDDGADSRRIIDASLRQYQSLGAFWWAGHTHAQLVSMAAVTGRPGWAWHNLRAFRDIWCADNLLHFNADLKRTEVSGFGCITYPGVPSPPFTLDANCAVAMGICDMLVQGWNDIVRVFPAVPDHWRDVAFRDLRTEGVFRVSAERREGRTIRVSVTAGVDRRLRLRDPFDGARAHASDHPCKRTRGHYTCFLRAGERVTLRRAT